MVLIPFMSRRSLRASKAVAASAWCRRQGTLLVCALVLTVAGSARAQSTADDMARRHFDSGVAYLEESDYDNALSAFKKAYELSPRPEILLNIATVQERRGDTEGALAALREYLVQAPNGEHVETVKLRIRNLERRSPEQTAPGPAETAPPAAAPPAQPPPKAPPPAAPPPVAEAGSDHTLAYVALGAGVLFGAGAVVTGVMAKGEHDDAKDSCSPSCTDDELADGRTLALTSTLLTGAALVGAGVGITLLLVDSSDERGDRRSLEVGAAWLPGGAGLRGSLRF